MSLSSVLRFVARPAALALCLTAALVSGQQAFAAGPLPRLRADPAKVSVSGLSSGGFMAVQYGVAYSASTMGVGVVAGGPYNCAFVNFGGITTCMKGAPVADASYGAAQAFAGLDQIDAVSYLATQRVYLFSGSKDSVVLPPVMEAVNAFYRRAGTSQLTFMREMPAGHAFVSTDFGGACDVNASPYVNECKTDEGLYDQPRAILTQIYGPLAPEATTLSAEPIAFNQRTYGSILTGLDRTGYVYVPASCRDAAAPPCALHVVFHGCLQGAEKVGDAVYGRLGYNGWAEANRIIVLYPQIATSALNPNGCWDWWGYSGLNFQTRAGPQPAAIHAMVRRLTGG
jgi:hypothetical protein